MSYSFQQIEGTPACRREGSELTREVLRAAGMAPSHEEEGRAPAGDVLHEPGNINPGGGGLRGALRGMIPVLGIVGDRSFPRTCLLRFTANTRISLRFSDCS